MLRTVLLPVACAALAVAQDTTMITHTRTDDIPNWSTWSLSIIPISDISNHPCGTACHHSTTSVTETAPTTLACVPESDMVFSVQTDTVLGNEPASTPICSPTTTFMPHGPIINGTTYGGPGPVRTNPTEPITGDTGTASMSTVTSTLNVTQSGTTGTTVSETSSGATASSSTPAAQSGNPAATMAMGGGLAGVLGLAAGMMLL